MAVGIKINNVYDSVVVSDLQYTTRFLSTYLDRARTMITSDMLNNATVNKSLVIWRHVMGKRSVAASGETIILKDAYEQQLYNTHMLIYSNDSSKVFYPVS
jgi:hypothetical protein